MIACNGGVMSSKSKSSIDCDLCTLLGDEGGVGVKFGGSLFDLHTSASRSRVAVLDGMGDNKG